MSSGRFLPLLFCLFLISALHAQSDSCAYSVSGTIRDNDDNDPLGYVSIYIPENPAKSTQTDERGQFNIKGLCAGQYTLICSHLSCERTTVVVQVPVNAPVTIIMPHHDHTGTTVVIADKSERPPVSQTRSEISGRKLDMVRGQSLGNAVSTVSGVTSLQTGGNISKPMIHGLHSNRLLILNNGIRQEGQQWGLEHAPEIDPFVASTITVIKGASAVRYGSDAIGGVILIEPGQLIGSPGIQGEVNFVGFTNNREGNLSAQWEQRFAKAPRIAYRLQGTMKKGGNFRAPDYWMKNTGSEELNFSGLVNYNGEKTDIEFFYSQFNTQLGILSSSHTGNITDLMLAIQSPRPLESSGFSYEIARPYQDVTHELMKVKLKHYFSEEWSASVVYARQYNGRMEFDKHRPRNDSLAALNRPELRYELTSHSTEFYMEHNQIRRFSGAFGISGLYQFNTYEGRFFIPNYRAENAGIWWIERWNGDSILTLEAGVRHDLRWMQVFMWENNTIIEPKHQFSNTSATAGAVVRLKDRFQFNINGGRSWRAPTANELYSNGLHHGAASIEIGDNTLRSETAWNVIATFNWHEHDDNEDDKIDVTATIYLHYFDNFIYARPLPDPVVTIRGAFPAYKFDQSDATLYGLDFSGNYHFDRTWSVNTRGSLLRAWNREENDWLIMMPADRVSAGLEFYREHFLGLQEFHSGINAQFVNRQFRTPYQQDFVAPPPSYYLMQCEFSAVIPTNKNKLTASISVNNVLNSSYRDYLNRFRYFADEAGINFRIHLKYNFQINHDNEKSK